MLFPLSPFPSPFAPVNPLDSTCTLLKKAPQKSSSQPMEVSPPGLTTLPVHGGRRTAHSYLGNGAGTPELDPGLSWFLIVQSSG